MPRSRRLWAVIYKGADKINYIWCVTSDYGSAIYQTYTLTNMGIGSSILPYVGPQYRMGSTVPACTHSTKTGPRSLPDP